MDDWKTQAEEDLQNLGKDRQAVDGIRAQILEKTADMIALTELGYGQPDAVERAPSPRMRKLMDEKRVLEAELAAQVAHVEQVDRVLKAMHKDYRTVLEECYCAGHSNIVEAVIRLTRMLNVGEATVYRIKRLALREFAHRMGYIRRKGKKR